MYVNEICVGLSRVDEVFTKHTFVMNDQVQNFHKIKYKYFLIIKKESYF